MVAGLERSLINHTLGAVFIGFAFACVLYGILITQVFHYFRRYPLDKLVYKLTVSVDLTMHPVCIDDLKSGGYDSVRTIRAAASHNWLR